jgi:hypothetical protein
VDNIRKDKNMPEPIRVYIAGPYSNGDTEDLEGRGKNVDDAIEVAELLSGIGFVPFIPHLTHFWDLRFPHPYGFWIEQDMEWLKLCDIVVVLPGDSHGVDMEIEAANQFGIPVLLLEEVITATIE